MKILIISTYFKPDVAANGTLMSELAEDLRAYGHKVTIITTMPHYDRNRIWGEYKGRLWIKERVGFSDIYRLYIYVPQKKNNLIKRVLSYTSWNFLSLVAGIVAGNHDIIFIPSPPLTNGLVGFIISKIYGIPFIYNVQDIYPDIAVRLGILSNRWPVRLLSCLEKFIYSKSASVAVISKGFKMNLLGKGVPESKICIVSNFVDTDRIRPLSQKNLFWQIQEPANKFVILFAGNIGLSQGLDQVLSAAYLLRNRDDIYFVFVGNGADKDSLITKAEQMELRNVIFFPFFAHADVPEMYASADICLVPLKRGLAEESVPSKVFSILSAAKPVVASVDEGCDTWKLVKEGECGLCIMPENPRALVKAIITLYSDRDLRIRMGLNGRKFVEEKYSRRLITRQYEQLFLDVMKRGV